MALLWVYAVRMTKVLAEMDTWCSICYTIPWPSPPAHSPGAKSENVERPNTDDGKDPSSAKWSVQHFLLFTPTLKESPLGAQSENAERPNRDDDLCTSSAE